MSSPLTIRDLEDGDAPFIWDSWLGCWRGSQSFLGQHTSEREMRTTDWFAWARAGITRIIRDPDVVIRVACLTEVPEEIAGYIVARPAQGRVDWVFVREPYRRTGLARRLLTEVFPVLPDQLVISYLTAYIVSLKRSGKINLRYIPA